MTDHQGFALPSKPVQISPSNDKLLMALSVMDVEVSRCLHALGKVGAVPIEFQEIREGFTQPPDATRKACAHPDPESWSIGVKGFHDLKELKVARQYAIAISGVEEQAERLWPPAISSNPVGQRG